MGFNSLEFFILTIVVFVLFWRLKDSLRQQNILLLCASYLFYAWWDWRFLGLIVLSSWVDFTIGKAIFASSTKKHKFRLLWLSIAVNLGLLFTFKYLDFFIDSLVLSFSLLGINLNVPSLRIVLPVGISFYTFQTLSYTIDIYRGRTKPTKSALNFFTFVSFFPQLVAGPIEKASYLLQQFNEKKVFSYARTVDGLRFILFGLFKKVVVADTASIVVDAVYTSPGSHSFIDLCVATFLFSIQLYCDFSGYSDMAIGTGRLFGFKLSRNFNYPFFARNIEELWQRWHMTLNIWFRDYFLISLLRSRFRVLGRMFLSLSMFIVIGLWHGANYTFVVWGLINGLWYIAYTHFVPKSKRLALSSEATIQEIPKAVITLSLVGFTLIFFRSPSLGFALDFYKEFVQFNFDISFKYLHFMVLAIGFIAWEWFARPHWHGLHLDHWPKIARWAVYILMIILIFYDFGRVEEFIYFQF